MSKLNKPKFSSKKLKFPQLNKIENINSNDNIKNTSNSSLQLKSKLKDQINTELFSQKRKREVDESEDKNNKMDTISSKDIVVPKVYLKKESNELSFDIDRVLQKNSKNPWDIKGRFNFNFYIY
jgi:hypothetical protein